MKSLTINIEGSAITVPEVCFVSLHYTMVHAEEGVPGKDSDTWRCYVNTIYQANTVDSLVLFDMNQPSSFTGGALRKQYETFWSDEMTKEAERMHIREGEFRIHTTYLNSPEFLTWRQIVTPFELNPDQFFVHRSEKACGEKVHMNNWIISLPQVQMATYNKTESGTTEVHWWDFDGNSFVFTTTEDEAQAFINAVANSMEQK